MISLLKCDIILIGDNKMVYIEKRKDRINRKRKGTRINIKSRAGEITSSNSIKKTKNTKKKNIKVFNIVIICLLCLLMIFGLIKLISGSSKTGDDNLIYNKNKSFIKHQKIKGIAFKDINCTYDGKNSLITYTSSWHSNAHRKIRLLMRQTKIFI